MNIVRPYKISKKRSVIIAVILASISIGLAAFCGYLYWLDMRVINMIPQVSFTSLGKQEAVIPFKLERGWIVIPVQLANKKVDCIVDTGSNNIVWPSSLKLQGQETGVVTGPFKVGYGAPNTKADFVVLPNIDLGAFHLAQCPTIRWQHPDDGYSSPTPLIGIWAFENVVLTIDYPHRRLIIRPSQKRQTPPPAGRNVFPFKPVCGYPDYEGTRGYHGVPSLVCQVNGRRVQTVVDTGFGGVTLGLSDPALIATMSRQSRSVFDKNIARYALTDLHWTVLGQPLQPKTALLPNVFVGADALLGVDFLYHYSITLDYPNRTIEFEDSTPNLPKSHPLK